MRARTIVFGLMALANAIDAARAQEPGAFDRSKPLTIIVPADPGGSYDLYARLISRFMPKYIPGSPNIIVQNMPGGGGLRALDYVYSVAPRDATTLAIPIQDLILTEALGGKDVSYRAADFNWIGRVSYTVDITVAWKDSPVKSIADAQRISVPIAGTGPNSPTVMNHVVLNNVIGTKFKIVPGYKASSDMLAAVERREADGAFSSWTTLKASYPHWVADRSVNILTVYALERFKELPDTPAVVEFARDADEKAILELIASTGFVGRSLLTTPGAPSERVAALRAAFKSMLEDAGFLDQLAKSKAEFEPLDGAAMQAFARSMRDLPPALIERAKAATKR